MDKALITNKQVVVKAAPKPVKAKLIAVIRHDPPAHLPTKRINIYV